MAQTKEEFIKKNIYIKQYTNGDFYISSIRCDVVGSVCGNVGGGVMGNVDGDVDGNVGGDVSGSVSGDVSGDVGGSVCGDVSGSVYGDVDGDVDGFADETITIRMVQHQGEEWYSPVIGGKRSSKLGETPDIAMLIGIGEKYIGRNSQFEKMALRMLKIDSVWAE